MLRCLLFAIKTQLEIDAEITPMNLLLPLFAQDDGGGGAIVVLLSLFCMLIVPLAILGVVLAGMWKVFEKAGQPGWASLVPIYNSYVLVVEIAKMDIMWFVLLLVPCVGFVAVFVIAMKLAKKFGQGDGFGVGLALLSPVFIPILGFGSARYNPSA